MILRLLIYFVLAYVIFSLLKHFFFSKKKGRQSGAGPVPNGGEPMVLDPQCQTYLPKSEAIFRDGNYFCSEKCAGLYLSRSGA